MSCHAFNGKGQILKYSAAYTITGQARFTISEVVADRQKPMVLQRSVAIHCPR